MLEALGVAERDTVEAIRRLEDDAKPADVRSPAVLKKLHSDLIKIRVEIKKLQGGLPTV